MGLILLVYLYLTQQEGSLAKQRGSFGRAVKVWKHWRGKPAGPEQNSSAGPAGNRLYGSNPSPYHNSSQFTYARNFFGTLRRTTMHPAASPNRAKVLGSGIEYRTKSMLMPMSLV